MKPYLCLPALVLLIFSSVSLAQWERTTNLQGFKAGGIRVVLPAPTAEFKEVGDEYRSVIFEVFVPTQNRLISAYVRDQDLTSLRALKPGMSLSPYAMVEVMRRAEFADCSQENFREVVSGASRSMGGVLSSTSKDMEEEMNRRLKALEVNAIRIGDLKQIGTFFDKPNAYGFGILTAMSQNDRQHTFAAATIFLRIKQRLLVAYLFSEYTGTETVRWLSETSGKWADAILEANQ